MIKIQQIIDTIEAVAPLHLQESYDNAGLIIGDPNQEVKQAIITLDVTEDILDEAIATGSDIVIAHHPIVFSGLKKINGKNMVERCVQKAIKNDIAIYASHTNLDSVWGGVNSKIADKIGLINQQILRPNYNPIFKFTTFIPKTHIDQVIEKLSEKGFGRIGNYDSCSFTTEGTGQFRPLDGAKPYIGQTDQLEKVQEIRFECTLKSTELTAFIQTLKDAHPYEEVAYDIIETTQKEATSGLGMVGDLPEAINTQTFLQQLSDTFEIPVIKHSNICHEKIQKVALCGGAGSSFLKDAIKHKADIYITGDVKYHDFFNAEEKIIFADIGHFESEQFTKEVFYEILTKKIPNFAVRMSAISSNAVNYYIGKS
ncbi:Nif3-like dinuclear metal center hexameric protein [Halosquirtibacter xylanolyticus]|uniref:Nif3-like dinuclear metal center hexameric protein n=1 Tax=Halosquirtibacter xylanolyticus TaxID=3374599 RepID=UPI0037499983|nr:Nif3-like dinuclear metal center hexameric protein [Prolixibacteraceae bacterium]